MPNAPKQQAVLASDGVVSVAPDGKVLPELFPSNALSLFEENLRDLVAQAVVSGDLRYVVADTGLGFVQRLEAGGSEVVARRGALSVVRTGIDKVAIEKAQEIAGNVWSFKRSSEIEGYVIVGARLSDMPEKVYRIRIKSTHEVEVIDEDGGVAAREKVDISIPAEQAMRSSSFKAKIGEIAEKSMAIAMALWGLMTLAEATNSHVRPTVADVERMMVEAGMTCAMAVPMIVGGGLAGGFALVGCLGTALSVGIDLYKMFQFEEPVFSLSIPWDVGAIERKLEAFARGGTSFLYRTVDYMRGIAYPEGFAKVGALAFGGHEVTSALSAPLQAPKLPLLPALSPPLAAFRAIQQTMGIAPRFDPRAVERLAGVLGTVPAPQLPALLAPRTVVSPLEGPLLSLSGRLTRDVFADLVALAMRGPEESYIVDRLYARLAANESSLRGAKDVPLAAPKPAGASEEVAIRANQQTVTASPTLPPPPNPAILSALPLVASGTFLALAKADELEHKVKIIESKIENVGRSNAGPASLREAVRAEVEAIANEVPDCCDAPFDSERYPISPKLKSRLGLPKWALPEIHLPSLPMMAGLMGIGFVVSLVAQLLADIEYPP